MHVEPDRRIRAFRIIVTGPCGMEAEEWQQVMQLVADGRRPTVLRSWEKMQRPDVWRSVQDKHSSMAGQLK